MLDREKVTIDHLGNQSRDFRIRGYFGRHVNVGWRNASLLTRLASSIKQQQKVVLKTLQFLNYCRRRINRINRFHILCHLVP